MLLYIYTHGRIRKSIGGRFGEFSTLDNFNKASFILGFENWNRDDFKALLKLVKSFVLLGRRNCMVIRIVWSLVVLALVL